MIIQQHNTDLTTPTGLMRTTVYRPQADGQFPAIVFYSEIFQQTAPIARSAALLASHGFVVLVPEVFHLVYRPCAQMNCFLLELVMYCCEYPLRISKH